MISNHEKFYAAAAAQERKPFSAGFALVIVGIITCCGTAAYMLQTRTPDAPRQFTPSPTPPAPAPVALLKQPPPKNVDRQTMSRLITADIKRLVTAHCVRHDKFENEVTDKEVLALMGVAVLEHMNYYWDEMMYVGGDLGPGMGRREEAALYDGMFDVAKKYCLEYGVIPSEADRTELNKVVRIFIQSALDNSGRMTRSQHAAASAARVAEELSVREQHNEVLYQINEQRRIVDSAASTSAEKLTAQRKIDELRAEEKRLSDRYSAIVKQQNTKQ